MTASQTLYRLQTLDLSIAQRRARLKAIHAELGHNTVVSAAQQRVEDAEKTLRAAQTHARDLELEIKSITEKIAETDKTLYGGTVNSPKALTELQEEIEALQRRQRQLEDTLLETMSQSDAAQTVAAEAKSALTLAQTEHVGSQTHLLEEQALLDSELSKLTAQRDALLPSIDHTLLSIYETLRGRKGGHAVSLLKEESCARCGVEQTAMTISQVRQGKGVVYCNTCGRILAPA
jgi:predicted  nucleic acid-binding Zn-ribbon protein